MKMNDQPRVKVRVCVEWIAMVLLCVYFANFFSNMISPQRQLFLDTDSLNQSSSVMAFVYKENPQTFAGAMAAFALGSYMAYHNNYESDQKTNEIFQKLARQFDAGIKSNPADYEKLSLRDIKDTYLRMSMLGMQLMIATAYARQNHADANIIAELKDSGRQGLETAFGTSADNIDISTAGLSRK